MSQVEVLIHRETLPACEMRTSPDREAAYVGSVNGEPPGGGASNQGDKHHQVINFQQQEEPRRNVVTFNGESKDEVQKQPTPPPQNNGNRKKRHRRGKKRKWRPYCKLTWEERKEVQEREAKRAEKVRAEMCACGITLAPYNTTQFLMEDHNLQEPDYEHIPVGHHHRHRENSNSNDSSDDFYSSPEDEEDFLQQQFTETYKNIHAERLSNMTKGELVQELMSVEDRVEALQKRLDEIARTAAQEPARDSERAASENLEEQMEKIRVFKEEIRKLTEENERLKRENEELRILTAHS